MKPHTNFRTVPVTERLPEKEGSYIVYDKIIDNVATSAFDPKLKSDINDWNDSIEWWAEEIPGQAEHESPFCPYCGNFKRMPGNDLIVPLCICTDWSNQPTPKPTDEDIENDLLDALEHICHNAAVIQLVAKSKGSLLEESYHIALETIDRSKDFRDGKIVKPKE